MFIETLVDLHVEPEPARSLCFTVHVCLGGVQCMSGGLVLRACADPASTVLLV